jgi:hypothetical protein
MGEINKPRSALLILAAFSRHEEALEWGRNVAEQKWGPVALRSNVFSFEKTLYYEKSMGSGLRKVFFAFENLLDLEALPQVKQVTNSLEEGYRDEHSWPEPRPLNLDPGYITEAKLVLATTKDRDHRIYLGEGIYAEVTLHYQSGEWRAREWTYPDYAHADYHAFFSRCREFLRQRYRQESGG